MKQTNKTDLILEALAALVLCASLYAMTVLVFCL